MTWFIVKISMLAIGIVCIVIADRLLKRWNSHQVAADAFARNDDSDGESFLFTFAQKKADRLHWMVWVFFAAGAILALNSLMFLALDSIWS
jgi:hypothetical protein